MLGEAEAVGEYVKWKAGGDRQRPGGAWEGEQLAFVKKAKIQHTSPSSAHSDPEVTYKDMRL